MEGTLVSLQEPARCYTTSRETILFKPRRQIFSSLQYNRFIPSSWKCKLSAFLVNFVHGELVLEVREYLTDEVSSFLVDEVTGAFLELFRLYNLKLVSRELVVVGAGYNYAQIK
jgi:hypothetical protein